MRKDAVEGLLCRVAGVLSPRGTLIVQTLHPVTACGTVPYEDEWRSGTWDGFSSDFADPAPWYFRTMHSWMRLFVDCGYPSARVVEPVDPATGKPISAIFIAEIA